MDHYLTRLRCLGSDVCTAVCHFLKSYVYVHGSVGDSPDYVVLNVVLVAKCGALWGGGRVRVEVPRLPAHLRGGQLRWRVGRAVHGREMQVQPMKPVLKAPGTKRLKL